MREFPKDVTRGLRGRALRQALVDHQRAAIEWFEEAGSYEGEKGAQVRAADEAHLKALEARLRWCC